jgi:SAM-dependent methyltransferase
MTLKDRLRGRRAEWQVPDDAKKVARHLVVAEFLRQIEASRLATPLKVAVVGGSVNGIEEPEIVAMSGVGIEFDVTTFGIDHSCDEFLDLNEQRSDLAQFDLVLCSQVLEHVWNHTAAFFNLAALVRPGGWIWMACPASNRVHSSPAYYSAGFSPAYLALNLKRSGFDVREMGQIGSERLYFLTHIIGNWPSGLQYRRPFKHVLSTFSLRSIGLLVRQLPILLMEYRFSVEERWATEAWAFAQRRSV